MSDYIRTTRECSVLELQPELFHMLEKHFQEREIGDVQSDAQFCCETVSRKKRLPKVISWFSSRPDTVIYTAMVLTSQQLIWIHYGDKSGILLNSADLNKILVTVYTTLFTKDTGLEIDGYIGKSNARARGRIALSADPAAQKFCEEVKKAIDKANPPAPKNWFKWTSN